MSNFVKSEDGPPSPSRSSVSKWVRSVFWSTAGCLATVAGVAMYLEARSDNPVARHVTAADLLQIDKPESLPDWIEYNPPKAFNPGVEYAKITSRSLTSKF